MGVQVQRLTHDDDTTARVFVADRMGDEYAVVFDKTDTGTYHVRYIVLPTDEWNVDVFQDAMEVRDEAMLFLEAEHDVEATSGEMEMYQIVPQSMESTAADKLATA